MKERPILMSAPMVRAILEGRKTQTRRIVKPMNVKQKKWLDADLINKVPHGELIYGGWQMHHPKAGTFSEGVYVNYDSPLGWIRCPYGIIGDILWVRETWQKIEGNRIIYKADPIIWGGKWRPSIFMPRVASRIKLEITNVRIERLCDITEEDAKAEGVYFYGWDDYDQTDYKNYSYNDKGMCDDWGVQTAKESYQTLWESINGKYSWGKNPWVWVIEFKSGKP